MITENFVFPFDAVRTEVKAIVAKHGFELISDDSITGLMKMKVKEDGRFRYREVHFMLTAGNAGQTKVRIICIRKIMGIQNPFVSFVIEESALMDELKDGMRKLKIG